MKNKYLPAVPVIVFLVFLSAVFIVDKKETVQAPVTDSSGSETPSISTSAGAPLRSPKSNSSDKKYGISELEVNRINEILEEVSIRNSEGQTEEAMNELQSLVDDYDNLSDQDKSRVLSAYARYFQKNGNLDEAILFYEAYLDLPGLKPSNRQATLQLLARFASRDEDWEAFLVYNDRFFAAGGEYNYLANDGLVRAYKGLGEYDSAGGAFIQYLDRGIDPVTVETDERYQRWVGINADLPLQMSDRTLALELARRLTQQYNREENWRVLAELYRQRGDQPGYESVIAEAQNLGFLTTSNSQN